jgi:hypothetical protein
MIRKNELGKVAVVFTLILAECLFTFAGCKGETSKKISLNGKRVLIVEQGASYDIDTYEARSEEEEILLEARRRFLRDNDLYMSVVQIADFQEIINIFLTGNKDYGVYLLEGKQVMQLYKQNLLFPLSDSSVELPERDFNKMTENLVTFNGKVYASSMGATADAWQDGVIFYNKRLFAEIGEDPDVLYNMQRDGTWTWNAFENFLRRLTVDFNNDGIIDQHGTAFDWDPTCGLLESLIYTNNADFVTLDDNGVFHDGTKTPAFLEAVQFYKRLLTEGVIKLHDAIPHHDPNNPDWVATQVEWGYSYWQFMDGKVAMLLAPEWVKTMMGGMVDDYGMVLPPKGPRAAGYRVGSTCRWFGIPSFFTKDEVDVILTAYKGWEDDGRPYDPDGWKEGHRWAVRDTRSIEETGVMQRDNRNVAYKIHSLVPGYTDGPMAEFVHEIVVTDSSPAQLLESYTPRFLAFIDAANR